MKDTRFFRRFSGFACLLISLAGCGGAHEMTHADQFPARPVPAAASGSLWSGENTKNRFFADFRARDVGDIITVTIVEKTEAKKEATTATGRDSIEDASVTDMFGMPLDFGMKNFAKLGNPFSPTVKGGHSNSFDGSGSTERKGEITANITVRVREVLPNGNLFVEGKKETTVNREKQYIILSGIVRTEDISRANTIPSDSIADLRIELSGYGVLSDKQGPGWLTRVLDKAWPF
ncbi:MAG: flagellar basal body L-ring protein FlgH [Deltaproteobacteria bacterium]|nr:flagellar basal body L-ring protein FlgH [Deltaproteobacteria bacterium]